MDLDYRLDLRDGEYKLLDFNPRVGAQFRVFEDEAAVDVVRALHLDLTGWPVCRRPQAEGRVFIVEHSDLLASVGYRHAGDLSLGSWRSSLRGIPPGAGLLRPRRPGSVPAHVRALPAQRRPAGPAASAAPCPAGPDAEVRARQAEEATTVKVLYIAGTGRRRLIQQQPAPLSACAARRCGRP
jgi:hypothetical protein